MDRRRLETSGISLTMAIELKVLLNRYSCEQPYSDGIRLSAGCLSYLLIRLLPSDGNKTTTGAASV